MTRLRAWWWLWRRRKALERALIAELPKDGTWMPAEDVIRAALERLGDMP